MEYDKPLFEREKMVWRLPNGDAFDDSLSFQRSMLKKNDGAANKLITLSCVMSIFLAVITSAFICIAAAIHIAIVIFAANLLGRVHRTASLLRMKLWHR